ncbi:MAG: hypothetical protein HOL01_02210 [Planctomycetaceae bacterium]|nr:hypothetical protein [Planctomycetaceae bacterium]MBT6486673.1 hypothetical protein [Planctomycetaceae bacterium]MBT6493342.1 hypothetical protein [Planctomycetaceae bacterium]
MAQAYTPGLKVTNRLSHRMRRVLPIAGEVKASVGDRVQARDVVAETFMPGDITPVNLSNTLSLPPADVLECMLISEGERVEIGQSLARTKGIFGLFKSEYKSKAAGTVESISNVTGQLIIRGKPLPVQVRAFLAGEVVEVIPNEGVVIEAEVSYVQGIFGIGGETYGSVRMACQQHTDELKADLIKPDMEDCVIVGGARMTGDAVRRAIEVGAAAVISGGMDDQDLRDILGYDLGVAITGSEQIGITLVITEGFGEIAMAKRTFELFSSREAADAAVNGATQIRAGVMRPEIVIPLSEEEKAREVEPEHTAGLLEVGAAVRIIRDPYFGQIGKVAGLPAELTVLNSESMARILEVECESGERVAVPRANVEMIEV